VSAPPPPPTTTVEQSQPSSLQFQSTTTSLTAPDVKAESSGLPEGTQWRYR